MTQPLYQQLSSTSRTTVVFLILYYPEVLGKHHIDKKENAYSLYVSYYRWNPYNVPTTCKPTIKGLASRYVYWSCVKKPKIDGFEKNKKMEIEGGTVSIEYILVIHKATDFMSLFSISLAFSFK